MKAFLAVALLLAMAITATSQPNANEQMAIERWLESLAQMDIEVENNEEIEYLIKLITDPINLNNTDKETLEKIFFLTDIQIENLLAYLYINGPMLTVYELQGIEGFTQSTIELLAPLVKVEPVGIRKMNTSGYTLFRTQSIIENPKGYQSINSQPSAYAGNKYRLMLKSEIESSHFKIGISAEKDPGEPLVDQSTSLPDFYTGYIQYSGNKMVSEIIIGSYRANFGQGLSLSNSYNRSMLADPINIRQRTRKFSGYNSTDEFNYLNGMAVDLNLTSKLSLSTFLSLKKLDGHLNDDSTSVSSINEAGYHRTNSEMGLKNSINETIMGGALLYQFNKTNVETGAYHGSYNMDIALTDDPYKQYHFNGGTFNHAWLAYTTVLSKMVLFGEMALHQSSALGLVQGVIWEPDSKLNVAIKYSQFNNGYYAPYMSPGTNSDNPSGEQQLNIGLKIVPGNNWTVSMYHIVFNNDWLKYQTDAPSYGHESMVRIEKKVAQSFNLSLQYRHRSTIKNMVAEVNSQFKVEEIQQENMRLQCHYTIDANWTVVTRIENSTISPAMSHPSVGWLFYQDLIFLSNKQHWKVHLRYCHFDTDDYESRIYAMEPNVLYAFTVPAYQETGSRMLLNIRYELNSTINLYLKIGQTNFSDKSQIGSGNELINGSKKTDVTFQIRYLIR